MAIVSRRLAHVGIYPDMSQQAADDRHVSAMTEDRL
jgi:hypothetical protein